MAGGEEADPAKGEYPLPDGDGREDVPDEMLGGVLHPAGVAGGADAGFAREGDEPLETAVRTADSREAAGEDAAVEKARSSRSTNAARPRPCALRSRAAATR